MKRKIFIVAIIIGLLISIITPLTIIQAESNVVDKQEVIDHFARYLSNFQVLAPTRTSREMLKYIGENLNDSYVTDEGESVNYSGWSIRISTWGLGLFNGVYVITPAIIYGLIKGMSTAGTVNGQTLKQEYLTSLNNNIPVSDLKGFWNSTIRDLCNAEIANGVTGNQAVEDCQAMGTDEDITDTLSGVDASLTKIFNNLAHAINYAKTHGTGLITADQLPNNSPFLGGSDSLVKSEALYSSNRDATKISDSQASTQNQLKKFFIFQMLGIEQITTRRGVYKIHAFVIAMLFIFALLKGISAGMSGGGGNLLNTIFSEFFRLFTTYFIAGLIIYNILYYILDKGYSDVVTQLITSYIVAMHKILISITSLGFGRTVACFFIGILGAFLKVSIVVGIANMFVNIIFAIVIVNVLAAITYLVYPLIFLEEFPGLNAFAQVTKGMYFRLIETLSKFSIITIVMLIFADMVGLVNESIMVGGKVLGTGGVIGATLFVLFMGNAAVNLMAALFKQIWQDALKFIS